MRLTRFKRSDGRVYAGLANDNGSSAEHYSLFLEPIRGLFERALVTGDGIVEDGAGQPLIDKYSTMAELIDSFGGRDKMPSEILALAA